MQTKYLDIVKALEARVRVGDYALANLPGERRIAEEFGVSHMTARRAVTHMLNNGMLSRPSGRLRVARPGRTAKHQLQICCILPAFHSDILQEGYRELSKVVAEQHGLTRAVMYVHQEDPAIQQALLGDFTGFFICPPHKPSQLLLDQMVRIREKLVTLWHDHTALGIPCVEQGPVSAVDKLIEMLSQAGHRRIDCLNTQPEDTVVRARITAWREALGRRGLGGDLYDLPIEPFGETGLAARDHSRRLFETGRITSTAMFCVTTAAAVGVCRACYELNIQVGKQYSICGFGEMTMARLQSPSLTVAEPADMIPYLRMGLDWILSAGKRPDKPLLFQPDDAHIWIGESTGPANPLDA